jgi:hypothetical protein
LVKRWVNSRRRFALQEDRKYVSAEIQRLEEESSASRTLSDITDGQIVQLLAKAAGNILHRHREKLKDFLKLLIEKVFYDPETSACRIHYQIGIENRNRVASPRVRRSIPVLRGISFLTLASRSRSASS